MNERDNALSLLMAAVVAEIVDQYEGDSHEGTDEEVDSPVTSGEAIEASERQSPRAAARANRSR